MNCQKTNFDRRMKEVVGGLRREGRVPRLLLHACCAPCSSASIERVFQDFEVTVFYFNPNIDDEGEYQKRVLEEKRLVHELNEMIGSGDYGELRLDPEAGIPKRIGVMEGRYDPWEFYAAVKGFEGEREGGARCSLCFRLRLEETARVAREHGFDYFTTTLTISPLKDAARLNAIGAEAGKLFGVDFLPSDFKKRDGYRRSIALSRLFGLYRQNYCGCSFSRPD